MKKMIVAVAIIVVFSATAASWAEEKFILGNKSLDASEARWSLLKKTGGFIGGWASAFVVHELGHQAMASLNGTHITWSAGGGYPQNIKWTAYNYSESSLRQITLAGFGAQIISAEALLFFDEVPKDNAFVLGWLGYHVINTLAYVLVDRLSQDGIGDFKTLRAQAGMSRGEVNLLELGLVAHAALTTYRVFKNPKVKPYVKTTGREIVVGIGWLW